MIKILVVDDSSFMRVKIKSALEQNKNIKVAGIARNGAEAIEKNITLKPDVITMDVNMPVMSGIIAVREIMRSHPTPIIMVSSYTQKGAKETIEALKFGAIDYITKDDIEKDYFVEKVIIAASGTIDTAEEKLINFNLTKKACFIPEKSVCSNKKSCFSIVGIGISTGGPRALVQLIPKISSEISCPIIIAQHMPPMFTRSLAEHLDSISKIHVKEAFDLEEVLPGHVYICPGAYHALMKKNGIISLFPKETFNETFVPSVNILMESIGKTYGEKGICIVMTGMGADGLKGIKKAKAAGSYIIAQSELTSTIYGMPKVIISAGLHDEILDANEIGHRINQLCCFYDIK